MYLTNFTFSQCGYIFLSLLFFFFLNLSLPHEELLVNDPGLLYDPVYLWMERGHRGGKISVYKVKRK
jgi:hypothetical protein